jgi:hypothetical protein
MSETELIAFAIFTVATGTTIVLTTIVRAWARRGGGKASAAPTASMQDERMARIEQAMDAIALEVERISEGQRFTTKLLAERIPERVKERVPERVAGGLPANDTNGHRAPAMRARSDHA